MKRKLIYGILERFVVVFIIIGLCSLSYGGIDETQDVISGITLPPNTPMLNTTLTTGVLLVQFSDWQTNIDSRGSVGYIDNNGDHIPDVVQYDKYHYSNYWNLVFSENQYTGTAHPDYNDYYRYSPLWNTANLTVYGSVHDYWKEVSYGNLNVAPGTTRSGQSGIVNKNDAYGVITWITLSKTKQSYYNPGSLYKGVDVIASEAISEAQQLYQSGQLDVNINNVQRLVILFAGTHIYGVSTIGYYNNNNSMWVIDAEKYGDAANPITGTFRYLSVITHEFGHTLGFDDYHGYLLNPTNYGIGHYSLMGSNDPNVRNSPPHLDPFNKLIKGWIGNIMVNSPNYSPLANQYIPPVEEEYNGGSPYVAVIPINGTPGQNGNWQQGEYFIVENRRVQNFDRFLNDGDNSFKGGFIVWHYTSTYPSTLHDRIPLEVTEADGRYDLAKPLGTGDYGTPSDFWPGATANNVLSPWSTPNSKFGNGNITDAGVEVRSYDINTGSYNVDLYYADIADASPSKPQNLQQALNPQQAPVITWAANSEPNLTGYNIYRCIYCNGTLAQANTKINPSVITSNSYTDGNWTNLPGIPSGANVQFAYRVTALNSLAKESVKSDSAAVNYTYAGVLLALAYQNKSISSQSTAFNGQRKFYRESSGKLHEVFASGTITAGEIFYRNSTDNGATWNNTKRLSDGTATSLAPCITVGPGPTVIAAWQQTNGSNYNVVFSRSTNGGSSWSAISTIQSNFSCASTGPLPSLSANMNTGSVVVVYRTSSGLKYVYSTSNLSSWSGPSSVPNTDGNYNSPSTAFYPVYSPPTDKCNLTYSTYVGYSSRVYYNYFSFESGSWSSTTNLSSVLPTSYQEHKDPCIAVSSNSYTTAHVAWEATLLAPPTPVLVHRKGSSGNFGSQYTVIQYQSANNPSITGLTSDNAWMVFQNSSGGGFSKVHYYLSGGSWIWGSPAYVSSGNYAQLSVGSSSVKYLWTAGTASPYPISIGTESLSKSAPLAFDYSRELNFIDTASGSSISLEVRQPEIVHKDGSVSLISFADAPPDSVIISPKEILSYGNTQTFAALADIDTLRLQYSVRSISPSNLLQKANGSLSFGILDESTGRLLGTIANRAVAEVADSTNSVYEIDVPANVLRSLANGKDISIRPSIVGLLPSQAIASLGHVYRLGAGEASELQKGTLAESIMPQDYILEQNYPNPYNPTTVISYTIPKDGMVTLKVYDVLGREVQTLVNEIQKVGRYDITFDATRLASGVYFYKLVSGSNVITKKMLLVK